MTASFVEYMGWISLSANLKESFEKAEKIALELSHAELNIPHLLLALIDNPEAAISLSNHQIDRRQLRHHLIHHELSFRNKKLLMQDENQAQTQTLRPAKRIQRLMAQASQKADLNGKSEIDGGNVIDALLEIEKQVADYYSQKKQTFRKQDTESRYKYQDDLFAYDSYDKLLNWGSIPNQTNFSGLYLSALKDQKLASGLEASPETPYNLELTDFTQKPHSTVLTIGSDKKMNYSYPAHNTIEYEQIKSSLDALMERRADAEKVLADCEWYQLLKNLELVSDDLDETVDRHQKKLVKKARQEIGKVDRWRKAFLYISHLDDELSKFRNLEELALKAERRAEKDPVKDIVIVEMENNEMSQAMEERMRLLEQHLFQLEKKLKSKKKKKYYTHNVAETNENKSLGQASSVSDYYLETLQGKIKSLESMVESQNQSLANMRDQSQSFGSNNSGLERDKITLTREVSMLQGENDSLTHRVADLETKLTQQDSHQSSLLPELEREKSTLKHEVSMLQSENDNLTHRVAQLESNTLQQDTKIVTLRDKASRRKQRLTDLSSRHDSLVPELEREKATLKHEVSMLQDENDKLTHHVAELETRHNSLAEEYSGSSSEFSALRDAHDRAIEKNDKRKSYILSLEEQIKGLESNNQRQDKLVIELHSEIEHLKTNEERQKRITEDLIKQINDHKNSTHSLAQEKHNLDERLRLVASESDGQGQKVALLTAEIQNLKEQLRQHEGYANSREHKMKTLTSEIHSSNEIMQSVNEKLTLQKDKAASRERHVRTLEQHVKAQENEISILKKQIASQTTQAVAPKYAAPGRRTTVTWRDNDSLVEIVRAAM